MKANLGYKLIVLRDSWHFFCPLSALVADVSSLTAGRLHEGRSGATTAAPVNEEFRHNKTDDLSAH